MKKNFISILLIILLTAGVVLLFGNQREINVIERREASKISILNVSEVLDGSFTRKLDKVLSDQMFYRDNMLNLYYKIQTKFQHIFTDLAEIDGIAVTKDGYCLEDVYQGDYAEGLDTIAKKGYNIKQIAEKYEKIKVYVYMPTRVEQTLFLDGNAKKNLINDYLNIFKIQLGDNVTFKQLTLDSVDDYKNYYYKTDLHWNAAGAYKGYSDIINMINEDFQIGSPKNILNTVTYDFPFFGYYGARLGNSINCDYIEDFDLGINEDDYDYYINGSLSKISDIKNAYVEGIRYPYSSDYDIYFGDNDYERIFDFHNPEKPNILIFSDSFVNPIKDSIASHFNKTVIIDLRANTGEFNLDDYIEEYQIDAVLFLQFYKNLYFNGYFFVPF